MDPFVKEMIYYVDKSVVLDSGVIDSPVLGKILPTGLSGGVKTIILVKFEKDKIFNTSTGGDNCAGWFLKIAEKEDRTINLHHLMDFGKEGCDILILNTNQIVHTKIELVSIAGEFVIEKINRSGGLRPLIFNFTYRIIPLHSLRFCLQQYAFQGLLLSCHVL